MARELGQLYVAVNCRKCGVHGEGKPASDGRTRCGKCGTFAQEAEQYCIEHDIHYADTYPDDPHCPMCRQERDMRSREMHERTRDPQMEPW